jgi:hypothetical protein
VSRRELATEHRTGELVAYSFYVSVDHLGEEGGLIAQVVFIRIVGVAVLAPRPAARSITASIGGGRRRGGGGVDEARGRSGEARSTGQRESVLPIRGTGLLFHRVAGATLFSFVVGARHRVTNMRLARWQSLALSKKSLLMLLGGEAGWNAEYVPTNAQAKGEKRLTSVIGILSIPHYSQHGRRSRCRGPS